MFWLLPLPLPQPQPLPNTVSVTLHVMVNATGEKNKFKFRLAVCAALALKTIAKQTYRQHTHTHIYTTHTQRSSLREHALLCTLSLCLESFAVCVSRRHGKKFLWTNWKKENGGALAHCTCSVWFAFKCHKMNVAIRFISLSSCPKLLRKLVQAIKFSQIWQLAEKWLTKCS